MLVDYDRILYILEPASYVGFIVFFDVWRKQLFPIPKNHGIGGW